MTDEQQLTAAGNEMSASFLAAKKRSDETLAKLEAKPSSFTMLTGDRPTGRLHLGHYFGSIRERVAMQERGVNTNIIIADYQVITDRDTTEHIQDNVLNLVLDYMAAGIDPNKTMMFTHSAVPAENQLLLPFLSLVTEAELHRNPTVKSEMEASGHALTGLLLTYPVHQACDILFCKANVVPIGKDNLPHVEITRTIARRFNERYAKKNPVFPEPAAILSEAPEIPGLDGRKMSKSYGNSIMLGATAEETAKLIKKSPTDSERRIAFDPVARPQVSALLTTAGLVTGRDPKDIAEEIGDSGAGALKAYVIESVNEFLAPHRERRAELAKDMDSIRDILQQARQRHRRGDPRPGARGHGHEVLIFPPLVARRRVSPNWATDTAFLYCGVCCVLSSLRGADFLFFRATRLSRRTSVHFMPMACINTYAPRTAMSLRRVAA